MVSVSVVFFGNAHNVFSWRFYEAVTQGGAQVVATVDVPPERRGSTNPEAARSTPSFVDAARAAGVPTYGPRDPNEPAFIQAMADLSPNLFFAAGYTARLGERLLRVPSVVAANAHASLLPAYRGRSPVFWALRHDEPEVGLTVHAMDAGLDTGEILYQVRVATHPDDSVASAYQRVVDAGVLLVPRLLDDVRAGTLERTPQSESGASYFSAPKPNDFLLDWSLPVDLVWRRVNASPGQCFADAEGVRVWFDSASVDGNHLTASVRCERRSS